MTTFEKGAHMSTIKEKMKGRREPPIAAIEKQFGKGAIMPLTGGDVAEDRPVVPTGSVRGSISRWASGGLPRGARHRDLRSPSLRARRRSRCRPSPRRSAAGGRVRLHRRRGTRSTSAYARKLGVRHRGPARLGSPTTARQALEIADKLVGTGAIDLIVVDFRRGARPPRARESRGEMGDAHMGLQARLMSQGAPQALRRPRRATTRR